MDFRLIVTDLDRKRLSVRVIHNDIAATLGPDIAGVYPSHALPSFPLSSDEASDADDRRPIDDADEAILFALNESPFAFVPQLSRLTHLFLPTIYCRLI
jgi:hypothetical protein